MKVEKNLLRLGVLLNLMAVVGAIWSLYKIGKWLLLEASIPLDVKVAIVVLFVIWLFYKVVGSEEG